MANKAHLQELFDSNGICSRIQNFENVVQGYEAPVMNSGKGNTKVEVEKRVEKANRKLAPQPQSE